MHTSTRATHHQLPLFTNHHEYRPCISRQECITFLVLTTLSVIALVIIPHEFHQEDGLIRAVRIGTGGLSGFCAMIIALNRLHQTGCHSPRRMAEKRLTSIDLSSAKTPKEAAELLKLYRTTTKKDPMGTQLRRFLNSQELIQAAFYLKKEKELPSLLFLYYGHRSYTESVDRLSIDLSTTPKTPALMEGFHILYENIQKSPDNNEQLQIYYQLLYQFYTPQELIHSLLRRIFLRGLHHDLYSVLDIENPTQLETLLMNQPKEALRAIFRTPNDLCGFLERKQGTKLTNKTINSILTRIATRGDPSHPWDIHQITFLPIVELRSRTPLLDCVERRAMETEALHTLRKEISQASRQKQESPFIHLITIHPPEDIRTVFGSPAEFILSAKRFVQLPNLIQMLENLAIRNASHIRQLSAWSTTQIGRYIALEHKDLKAAMLDKLHSRESHPSQELIEMVYVDFHEIKLGEEDDEGL